MKTILALILLSTSACALGFPPGYRDRAGSDGDQKRIMEFTRKMEERAGPETLKKWRKTVSDDVVTVQIIEIR